MNEIIVIVHDIRSTHNVGSILRTCDGFGVNAVYFTGYSPYPSHKSDTRLPHIAQKLNHQIHKTALGAEDTVPWLHEEDCSHLVARLKKSGYRIIGLEQSEQSIPLPAYQSPSKIVLLLGREVEGIDKRLLQQCDDVIEIPMYGKKESFNVTQACAIALYALRET